MTMLLTGVIVPPLSESKLWNYYDGNTMEVQPDFRDMLALLNEHKVDYLAGRMKDLADIEALGEDGQVTKYQSRNSLKTYFLPMYLYPFIPS